MVYSSSLLLIALIVLPANAVWNTFILLPFLFVLATGLSGIAATLAALASTHGEFFFAYQQIVQVVFLTLSTVFYPIDVIRQYLPQFLVNIVSMNPLSLAAEAMRQYTFAGSPVELWSLLTLLLTCMPLAIIGGLAYLGALRTIQVKGKL